MAKPEPPYIKVFNTGRMCNFRWRSKKPYWRRDQSWRLWGTRRPDHLSI